MVSSTAVIIVEILSAFRLLFGMTFINREPIVLLESNFHFQTECCIVPTVALFEIRSVLTGLLLTSGECSRASSRPLAARRI